MNQSQIWFSRAKKSIPGGVNSPVRAFKGVGGDPIFFKKGQGAYLIDVDDNHYIDYVGSWGPLILGHCHPGVLKAVNEALTQGMTFGAPTCGEVLLAEKIIQEMPALERVRFVNSGTEATMTAIRLARAWTKRTPIIKFNGCYHGHADPFLVKAGSGLLTLGIPSTPGVSEAVVADTLTADYNDLAQTKALFERHQIAAVIVEPVAGNMGFVMPDKDFLQGLAKLCKDHGALLIFDEVMTGFRVALGGAQALFGIKPELTTLGKVIGGGMPVGAIGGRADIMSQLAPEGPVYQAGTLSGNPLAMAAGLATLNELSDSSVYEKLTALSATLIEGLNDVAHRHGVPFTGGYLGGMFGFYFNEKGVVSNLADAASSNEVLFKQFYHGMLKEGIYLAPSMYEAGFMSLAHTKDDIDRTIRAADIVLRSLEAKP